LKGTEVSRRVKNNDHGVVQPLKSVGAKQKGTGVFVENQTAGRAALHGSETRKGQEREDKGTLWICLRRKWPPRGEREKKSAPVTERGNGGLLGRQLTKGNSNEKGVIQNRSRFFLEAIVPQTKKCLLLATCKRNLSEGILGPSNSGP